MSYSANGELKQGFLLNVASVSELRKESEIKYTSASVLWLLISLSLSSSLQSRAHFINLHLAQVTALEALIPQELFNLTFAGKLMPCHGRGLL